MSRLKKTLRIGLAVLAATQLTACSKTVQWEEEVPLNTGEVIWVKRSDTYEKVSAYANPLERVWGIKKRALKFTRHGQNYEFQTDTTAIMMIYQLDEAATRSSPPLS